MTAELKRRILYQSEFTSGKETRWDVTRRNFLATFIPKRDVNADGSVAAYPEEGWLFYYMTPGVYAASLLGLAYLAVRRQWRVLLFLLGWIVLMLGPPVVMGNSIFSRYVLAGVLPLLVAGAYLLADALGVAGFAARLPAAAAWTLAGLLLTGLLFQGAAR